MYKKIKTKNFCNANRILEKNPLEMIMKLSIIILTASFIFSSTASAGGGVSISRNFDANADAQVDQFTPDNSYGLAATMSVVSFMGTYPTISYRNKRSFVRFGISSIPTNSSVSSATLQLYVAGISSGRNYNIEKVAASWIELPPAVGFITWNNQPAVTGSYIQFPTPTNNAYTSWAVTSHVQDFVGGTTPNNGWRIKDNIEDNIGSNPTLTLRSKEYSGTTYDPKLSISFMAPWDSYSDSGRTTVSDSLNQGTIVYMKGTGFASGNYNVAYFDYSGNKVSTSNDIVVTSGILNDQYTLSSDAALGTWHALAQPSGSSTFPATYSDAVVASDTYNLVANDAFNVVDLTPPTYNVSGYVSNTGAALSDVLVQNLSKTNITDASGYYLIIGLVNGTYNFSYSKAGFDIGYSEVTVDGADVANANKTIFPHVRYINGTVTDSVSHLPLTGVDVSTIDTSTTILSTTDGSGKYSLAVLSGTYPLTATFDIRYYMNNSVTVSTESSAFVIQDIELLKKPIGNITGTVTNV